MKKNFSIHIGKRTTQTKPIEKEKYIVESTPLIPEQTNGKTTDKSIDKSPKQPSSLEKEKETKTSKLAKVSSSTKPEKYSKSQKSQKSQGVAIDDDDTTDEDVERKHNERKVPIGKTRRNREIDQFKDKKYDTIMTKELKHKGDDYNKRNDVNNSLLCYCEAIIGYCQMVKRKEMTFAQIKELLNFVYMFSEKNKHTEIGNGVNLIISQLYLHMLWNDHPNVGQFLKDDDFWKDNIIAICLSQLHKLK